MDEVSNIESPCIKVCEVDETTQLCKGCLRTIDEITSYPFLDDEAKIQLNQALEKRREQLLNSKKENPGMFD